MGSSTFVGLAALVWLPFRRMESTEPKPSFNRRGDRRAEERAEDGLFIMRPAFWGVLVFEATAHAGRSR